MGFQIRDETPDWEWDSRLGMEFQVGNGIQIGNGTPDWGWDSRLGMGLQLGIESWVGSDEGKVTPVDA